MEGKLPKKRWLFSLCWRRRPKPTFAFRIPGKTSEAVMETIRTLRSEYGDRFAKAFQAITIDNGSEFSDFEQETAWGAKVYFAHPYTSWGWPQNERHTDLFRAFVPKGASPLNSITDEDILATVDELNGRPRRKPATTPRRNYLSIP